MTAQKELRERRNAIAVAIRDAYDWPEIAEPWWPVFLRAADRVLALESAQRPEQGESVEAPAGQQERTVSLTDEQVQQLRATCHATYNGGHSEAATIKAFHHGMDTVCNILEAATRSAPNFPHWREAPAGQQCPECGAPVEATTHLNLEPGWKYAPVAAGQQVKMPETEDEAVMMTLLGEAWLREHAAHRLKPRAGQQDGALVERLKEMVDGKRQAKREKIGIPAFDARRDAAIEREIETLEAAAAALATRGDAPLAEDMEAFVESVESAIGMGRGAWDMVDHHELVRAIIALADGGAK